MQNLCLWFPALAQQLEDADNDDDDYAKLTDLLRTVVTIDNIGSDRVNLGLT